MKSLDIISQEFPNKMLRYEHPYYMYDAIKSIPGCLKACLDKNLLNEITSFLIDKHFSNFILIGCGTSLNSCQLAAYAIRELLNIPAYSINALDFIVETPIEFNQGTLVICSSHSGNTVPTYIAKDKAIKAGNKVISIIGNSGSKLEENSDLVIHDPFGKEVPFGKTRSFLSAALLATLPAILSLPEKEMDEEFNSILEMISAMDENFNSWEKTAISLSEDWGKRIDQYMFIGMGVHSAIANEMALKTIEVLTEPAIGFGLEESIHGPAASYSANVGIVLFQTDDRVLWRAKDIDNAVNATLASDLIITSSPDAGWSKKSKIIGLPKMKPIWASYCSAIVYHLVLYYLAVEKGFIPDVNGRDRNEYINNCKPFLKFSKGSNDLI
jgi:glucosamine--fructose-6-phosphate aminotransferase (isomerizing)